MTAKAAGETAEVLGAYDFSSSRRIVDVGGGRGHLLHAILEATPRARGILVDLPGVVEAGGPAHPRLVRQAGDFFVDPLPAADTYLVMDVIHDWADAEALAILTVIRRAAMDDTRVLLIEGLLPENLDPGSLTIDVIMLAVTGGRERTDAELGRLLDAAGLRLARVIDTPGRLRIAEARRVDAVNAQRPEERHESTH
jgi:C-methyltransferase